LDLVLAAFAGAVRQDSEMSKCDDWSSAGSGLYCDKSALRRSWACPTIPPNLESTR